MLRRCSYSLSYREMLSEKPNNRTVTIEQAFAVAQCQLRNSTRGSYHGCIDQFILELAKCDPRLSKRIVNISEQINQTLPNGSTHLGSFDFNSSTIIITLLTFSEHQIISICNDVTSLPSQKFLLAAFANFLPRRL
jgi:hypothetical protein